MAGNDSRIEIRLPGPLKDWAVAYAKGHNTTVSALVVRFLTRLNVEADKRKVVDADQV